MNDIISDIFKLIGKLLYVGEDILCRDAILGTIDHIEIRQESYCTLLLAVSNPCAPLVELNISRDELKQLASTWKINRNNQEIYVKLSKG